MIESDKIWGGCHCGEVRYSVNLPTIRRTHCHCDVCRAFGGTLMSWITVYDDSFTLIGSSVKIYQSSVLARREFCLNCGTHLTFRHAGSPELVDLSIGSLDYPELYAPDNQIWGSEKLDYLNTMNELPIVDRDNH